MASGEDLKDRRALEGRTRPHATVVPLSVTTLILLLLANVPGLRFDALARAASPDSKVVILVRTGRLALDEVSPGSRSRAREAWKVVWEGTALANLRRPPGDREQPASLKSLRSRLLAASDPAGTAPPPLLVIDFADNAAVAACVTAPRDREDRARPLPIRELETLFGPAPELSFEETAAVRTLRAKLLAQGDAGGSTGGVPAGWARLGEAPLALVRVVAEGDSAGEVERRDALLGQVSQAVGRTGHLVVLNLPRGGDATAFLKGPRLVRGKVIGAERDLGLLAGVVARLLNREPPGDASALTIEEVFR